MDSNEYQDKAMTTAVYPERGECSLTSTNYTVIGMVGEAGELANKLKKVHRGDKGLSAVRSDLMDELADVQWYIAACARELGFSLSDVMQHGLDKLSARQARGTIRGSGDNR